MLGPIFGILPALYAANTKVSLETIGFVFVFARLFDAVSDPVVGYFSDITRSRYGPRKPWIAVGAILSALSVLFFFAPSSNAGGSYFLFWCMSLFVGWTCLMIPYNAWAVELSGDYHGRASLFAWRNFFGGAGGLLFVSSPVLLHYWTGSTEFTFEVLWYLACLIAVIMPLSVGVAVYVVPKGRSVAIERPSLKGLVDSLRRNRVMWLFIGATLSSGLSQGAFISLQFIYISSYLELGEYISLFGVAQMGTYIVSIPIWLRAVKRFGKHLPWAYSSFVMALFAPVLIILPVGEASLIPMVIISLVAGFFNATHAVSPQAILADIIDYDTLKTGVNRAGNYFAFLTFLSKATTGLGSGLGLAIVGLLGFSPGAENDATAVWGLLAIIAIGPAVMGMITGFLILKYPLNEHKQNIIRKRIERRAERAERSNVA